ncbi:geranylgeranylglycerol-phosphate geranylgeranyltransferase [Aequorivita marina]|uniref:geranylgeranylglycerol-phosphate geranylgeranyltransferase n=1 Tax=Aequorivita marina TaxID=3073654 RepID=UPI002874C5E7|nr:geranylgeranylglycerol-phosphate geranylgeranyltransferase [Aequorivita sp. S2608]MDS1298817.1 geranylgeranylglycerol-phosphate geranylgeranyltransferase [Aequorivita sp. S2608]
MNFLNLIRYQNLLFIALVQVLIKYALFPAFNVDTSLNALDFALLILASLCIAAAGNVINDVYDVAIDKVNKPKKVLIGNKISETFANRLYIILNVIGVGVGFYLSNSIQKPGFAALFIIISALLYLYASYLKSVFLVGNLVVSILVAMSLLIVPIFELLPAITPENQASQTVGFKIVLNYALFAFYINLIREIVKDLEDINGDKKGEMNTLPIVLGRKRTVNLVFILAILAVLGLVLYMYENLYNVQLLMLYFLLALVAPLLYFCIKAWDAKRPKDYAFLSRLLKIIMFFGICALALYQFVILK